MKGPFITKEQISTILETGYINVYDLQYREGKHYFEASRRLRDALVCVKSDEEFQTMNPDAVTLCVILRTKEGDRLLTFYEYRYPCGRFLLSPPAGLIDPADKEKENALYLTAVRELYEETGLEFRPTDEYRVLNPGVFSSPGMTDESNGIVLLVLNDPDLSSLTDRHSEETELFNGFYLMNREEAVSCIQNGRDPYGNQYSVYMWQALLYFISDLWK